MKKYKLAVRSFKLCFCIAVGDCCPELLGYRRTRNLRSFFDILLTPVIRANMRICTKNKQQQPLTAHTDVSRGSRTIGKVLHNLRFHGIDRVTVPIGSRGLNHIRPCSMYWRIEGSGESVACTGSSQIISLCGSHMR